MARFVAVAAIIITALATVVFLCVASYMHGYAKGSDEAKGKV